MQKIIFFSICSFQNLGRDIHLREVIDSDAYLRKNPSISGNPDKIEKSGIFCSKFESYPKFFEGFLDFCAFFGKNWQNFQEFHRLLWILLIIWCFFFGLGFSNNWVTEKQKNKRTSNPDFLGCVFTVTFWNFENFIGNTRCRNDPKSLKCIWDTEGF